MALATISFGFVACSNGDDDDDDDSGGGSGTSAPTAPTAKNYTVADIANDTGYSFLAGGKTPHTLTIKSATATTNRQTGVTGYTGEVTYAIPAYHNNLSGVYTATPVSDKTNTYEFLFAFTTPSVSTQYWHIEIKDADTIVLYSADATVAVAETGTTATRTAETTSAETTFTPETIAGDTGYSFSAGTTTHTLTIKTATATKNPQTSAVTGYTGEASYAMGTSSYTGVYTATPVTGKDNTFLFTFAFTSPSTMFMYWQIEVTDINTIVMYKGTESVTAKETGTEASTLTTNVAKIASDYTTGTLSASVAVGGNTTAATPAENKLTITQTAKDTVSVVLPAFTNETDSASQSSSGMALPSITITGVTVAYANGAYTFTKDAAWTETVTVGEEEKTVTGTAFALSYATGKLNFSTTFSYGTMPFPFDVTYTE